MLKFNECTLLKLDKTFALSQVEENQILQDWIGSHADISDFEQQSLNLYQGILKRHVHDWNEVELRQHFIGPILTLVNFSNPKFTMFAERSFSGVVDDIELSGKPDGMIASGFREPEKPYFCFQEYNAYQHEIYGCYVVGDIWHFMVLHGKTYSISGSYAATRDDIVDIFIVLKRLKQIIIDLIEK
ncbi:MAG: hypothetical protein B6242_05905 [Anaerolineaceae bacterium 4572_78]|nr:MAG: hypothetical protein B6242_05905 [Anaerolineaceae bacterium 4572_78]